MVRPSPLRHDLDDDLAPSDDPVVRMPKRMYVPPPEQESSDTAGSRVIFLIAGVGALLGALLGALGLGIVWAMLEPLAAHPPAVARRARPVAPPVAAPAPSFALDLDASAPAELPPPTGPAYDVTQ